MMHNMYYGISANTASPPKQLCCITEIRLMICNIWKIKIWKKKRNIRHKDSVLIRYLSQGTELISVVTADVCDI